MQTLYVELQGIRLSAAGSAFFEGIKQNSSIREFKLSGYEHGLHNPVGEVCELLKAFHEKNSNLISLRIWACRDIRNASERVVINTTLSSCTNLKTIQFNHNNTTGEQLLPW